MFATSVKLKKKVSTKSVATTTSAGISVLECSDKSGRFGTQLEFFFFYQKSLLSPSLWLSTTERHSFPPSPASVGEISFNIPALWGRRRRSSLIGWAEMLPVFKTRQIHGCYWCFCLQCRFWKALSASGRVRCRRFSCPPFWKMEDGLLVNVYASRFKCTAYCWCLCSLLAPGLKCGVCKIRCSWLKASFFCGHSRANTLSRLLESSTVRWQKSNIYTYGNLYLW